MKLVLVCSFYVPRVEGSITMAEMSEYHLWLKNAVNVWNWFRQVGGAHISHRSAQVPGGAWFAMQASLEKLAGLPGAPDEFKQPWDRPKAIERSLQNAWLALYSTLEEADENGDLGSAGIEYIA
jgi:hypothetical protein